mgnify:CR=1 FL=1
MGIYVLQVNTGSEFRFREMLLQMFSSTRMAP